MDHSGLLNKMTISKALAISVSLILAVGVVVGVVVGINRNGHSSSDRSFKTDMKVVEAICGPTSYKDKCISTIAPVAANTSAGPKDFLRAALIATMEEVKLGIEKPGAMKNDGHGRIDKMALDDCKDFLQYAVKDLREALAMLDDNELNVVNDQVDEFRNWLTAVYAFQVICLDQILNPNLKAGMEDGLHNATLLSNNALDIFAKLSTILVALNVPLKVNPVPHHHRKLFDHVGHFGENGYPHWISEGDRRLLLEEVPKPNVVVAQDGSGQFKTIAQALASYPKTKLPPKSRYVIYVKAGVYEEVKLIVSVEQENVFMYGDGPEKTIITGNKDVHHFPMTDTASFSVLGKGFVAKSMGFRNTAGAMGNQALAILVQADMSAFFNCKIEGYQDSLGALQYRQFYRECIIAGSIDFVFGMSATVIQNSQIIVRFVSAGQQNVVAADGSDTTNSFSGLVFQNCTIVPDNALLAANPKPATFLARPWKPYSKAIFMESYMDGFIDPSGFSIWNNSNPQNEKCLFAEYGNRGPGAKTNGRVNWPACHKVFTDPKEVNGFTSGPFINGDKWLENSGVTFSLGLMNPSST